MNPIGLHVCCAPCLAAAVTTFRGQGVEPKQRIARLFFYNPNIHPLLEFRRRGKALRVYLERDPLPAEIDDGYGLELYLHAMLPGGTLRARRDRCFQCYAMRLGHVAGLCRERGLAAFSTTLFSSTQQDHDLVEQAGKEAGAGHDVEFVRHDFRCQPDPKLLRNIYKQQYCGCIFSERERFADTTLHLYKQDPS